MLEAGASAGDPQDKEAGDMVIYLENPSRSTKSLLEPRRRLSKALGYECAKTRRVSIYEQDQVDTELETVIPLQSLSNMGAPRAGRSGLDRTQC